MSHFYSLFLSDIMAMKGLICFCQYSLTVRKLYACGPLADIVNSSVRCFSELEHIAHYTAKNQSIASARGYAHTHTHTHTESHTHTHTYCTD